MLHKKPKILLASDSTVQSYEESNYPQTGWGQVLIQYFKGEESYSDSQVINCSYEQARCYESESIIIENRAIGGRSSRSFIEEGKFNQLLEVIDPSDYLFVQFGHNDATIERPNRYVSVEDFPSYITRYIKACSDKEATCVLVTPVARRNPDETGKFSISFNGYREAMIQLSKEYNIPLLDLGKYTTNYLEKYGVEETKELFMWLAPNEYPEGEHKDGLSDNTHLQLRGAKAYANILAHLIATYDTDDKLDSLKEIVAPKPIVPFISIP
ncbi:MAG: est12B [Anaerocolumna sp.]|jgi:lysophospholipase L1-like esterase|nr:est12B [Anaerocolumna sp.]